MLDKWRKTELQLLFAAHPSNALMAKPPGLSHGMQERSHRTITTASQSAGVRAGWKSLAGFQTQNIAILPSVCSSRLIVCLLILLSNFHLLVFLKVTIPDVFNNCFLGVSFCTCFWYYSRSLSSECCKAHSQILPKVITAQSNKYKNE